MKMTPRGLRLLRHAMGFIQNEMAVAIGVSHPQISHIETGKRPFTATNVIAYKRLAVFHAMHAVCRNGGDLAVCLYPDLHANTCCCELDNVILFAHFSKFGELLNSLIYIIDPCNLESLVGEVFPSRKKYC
jgi:DNA-binding XRE family transcriptional regulator